MASKRKTVPESGTTENNTQTINMLSRVVMFYQKNSATVDLWEFLFPSDHSFRLDPFPGST